MDYFKTPNGKKALGILIGAMLSIAGLYVAKTDNKIDDAVLDRAKGMAYEYMRDHNMTDDATYPINDDVDPIKLLKGIL